MSEQRELECSFYFSDITLVESDGDYELTNGLMQEELGDHDWNIATILTIESDFGIGSFELNFRKGRRIFIIEYGPSTPNIYYNPDMSALALWAQQNGWGVPEPAEALIKDNIVFWKHMWETLLIDSKYLDERYGERKSLRIDDDEDEEEDEDLI